MILLLLILVSLLVGARDEAPLKWTMADLLEKSKPSDWRTPLPENTLYLQLSSGRVVIELAPEFAPEHVKNIKTLAREKFWDDLFVVRVQDNYVAQWGDPHAEDVNLKKKYKKAKATLAPEFDISSKRAPAVTPLGDADVYAPSVGFWNGFAVAQDASQGKSWLIHCYGAVGAGRGNTTDSGNGAELYAVIGHSPRHLDRNVTLVGRILQGHELLSALPRGKGPMGFYQTAEERVKIVSVRLASDVPKSERTALEVLKTDTDLFKKLIEARKVRQEDWFYNKAHHIEVCNVPVPVRAKK